MGLNKTLRDGREFAMMMPISPISPFSRTRDAKISHDFK